MELLKLLGIVIVIAGFALKLDSILVILVAAVVTALVGGLGPVTLLETLGSTFVANRSMAIFIIVMLVTGTLERNGLREAAAALIGKFKGATSGLVIGIYGVMRSIFAAFNATMAIWAIWSYIGIRASTVDFFLGFLNWLYVPVKTPRTAATRPQIENELVNWEQILYHGDRRLSRDLKRSSDRRRRVNMLASKVEASGRVDVDSEPAGEAKKDTMTASAAKGAEYRS